MANQTDPTARSVHGTNPQNLVGEILRSKICENTYWKEQCFGLTAETLLDKAIELDHFGGIVGGANRKATPFMCLILKMLQIQPEKEIVVEFIKNEDHKYVRILGAFYLRMVGKPADVYQYLEPLYNDYRKLRRKLADGSYSAGRVDKFIDELLRTKNSCDIALPRVPTRWTLEGRGMLEPRRSALEDDFEEEEAKEEEKEEEEPAPGVLKQAVSERERRSRSPAKGSLDRDRNHAREWERDTDRDGDREKDRDFYHRDKNRDKERDYFRRDRDRHRDRERWRTSRRRSRERRDRDRDQRSIPPVVERKKRYRSPGPVVTHSRRADDDGPLEDGGHRANMDAGWEDKKKKNKMKDKKEKVKEKEPAADGADHADPDVAKSNQIRAALGLKALRL